jgi:hypothetical protein
MIMEMKTLERSKFDIHCEICLNCVLNVGKGYDR